MANVNRVDVNGETIVDLTADTVTAASLALGATAHDASGSAIEGAMMPVEVVQSTHASGTAAMTGESSAISELCDGQRIVLHLNQQTAASSTLNLTLADGTQTGAVPVYRYGSTRLSSNYSVGCMLPMTYQSPYSSGGSKVADAAWVLDGDIDTDAYAYSVRWGQNNAQRMHSALYRYQFCFTMRDGTLLPANAVSNGTGTSKALTTGAFDPARPIFYWNTTGTVAAGASPSAGNMYLQYHAADTRYSFNGGTSVLSAGAQVFLRCADQGDGTLKLDGNDALTCTLPTTADGKVYLYLGNAYDTYRMMLSAAHPCYVHDGDSLVPWTPVESGSVAIDSAPTSGSSNAVSSGGVYSALSGKAASSHSHAVSDVTGLQSALGAKQDALVSGTSIKTVNGESLLGSGDIAVSGGSGVSYKTATCTLPASGWTSNSITVNCTGVTASNDVIVAPAPASASAWAAAGIVCTAQGAGTLTFTRTSANTAALTANVLVLSGGGVANGGAPEWSRADDIEDDETP